ncbi:MAG: Type 1 glutamine amidotransferase-like domain-containing protein [bacterium]
MTHASPALDEDVAVPTSSGSSAVFLLGPQKRRSVVADVLAARGIRGRLACVTAGWQEREGEAEELEALRPRIVDLRLHARADVLFAADPSLAAAHRSRQDVLRSMRRLYDLRLGHATAALVELERRGGPPESVEWQRREALDALRELDERHLARVREIQAEWDVRLDLANRPAVAHHRAEVRAILAACDALLVAGGHVAILANRLRFFDVAAALHPSLPVVGWSAGAMALTERVVVYHDSPPWGPGNAEMFDAGLGLASNVVALPDGRRRLRFDDVPRVARFARRFAPAACVTLEEGDVLELTPTGFRASAGVCRLSAEGTLVEMGS